MLHWSSLRDKVLSFFLTCFSSLHLHIFSTPTPFIRLSSTLLPPIFSLLLWILVLSTVPSCSFCLLFPPAGGSPAGGEEQFAGRKSGPDGETQPVGLHRGHKQPSGAQTPAAADTAGAAAGGNLQVCSCCRERCWGQTRWCLINAANCSFRLEAAKDDYRIRCEELEKELLDVKSQNEELAALADEAQSLKDEMDVLRWGGLSTSWDH